ncbi:hypothetical protein R1flu_014309 [Riccia fluitans]|uniref:Reverse transcriptase domain-containing protein n=1 Tax=Riccia fluitans TaxID=41844 RepID=A0ABD1YFY9_9MARC
MVFELLRDCFTPEDPASGFDLLFDVCTHIAQGRLFAPTTYLLGASHLLALEKPLGGVRPIAVGEVDIQNAFNTISWEGDLLVGALFALAHLRALRTVVSEHPLCLFPSLADNTHIVGPLEAVVPAFHTLEDHLSVVELTVQPIKCAAWSPSGLPSSLSLPPSFTLPFAGL